MKILVYPNFNPFPVTRIILALIQLRENCKWLIEIAWYGPENLYRDTLKIQVSSEWIDRGWDLKPSAWLCQGPVHHLPCNDSQNSLQIQLLVVLPDDVDMGLEKPRQKKFWLTVTAFLQDSTAYYTGNANDEDSKHIHEGGLSDDGVQDKFLRMCAARCQFVSTVTGWHTGIPYNEKLLP